MLLSELLQNRFRADIRWRGQTYLDDERVSLIRITPDDVFGQVRENDSTEYATQVSRTEDDLKLACTCRLGSSAKPSCKHIWATVLAVESEGLLSGDVRPGHIPQFLAEPELPLFSGDDILEDPADAASGLDGGPGTGSTRRSRDTRQAVEVQQRQRAWEQRLGRVRAAMLERAGDRPVTSRETQVFFEIDVAASVQAGVLTVQTSQRQRRSDGQWGKLKALKLRVGRLDDVGHGDDRRILSYLVGGVPERGAGQAAVPELQGTLYRYRVPHDLACVVLPLMAATGRLRYLGDRESKVEPLEWDGGEPWELSVRVSREDDDSPWSVTGELQRADAVLPLSRARLLLPGGLMGTDESIAVLNDFDAFDWVSLLQDDEQFTAPSGDEADLVEQILDMPALPRLELPAELQLKEVRCEPQAVLMIHSPRGRRWKNERLQADVSFEYQNARIRAREARWAIVCREDRTCIPRDRAAEARLWSHLDQNGFRRLLDRRAAHDVEVAARDLGPSIRALIEQGWSVQADGQQVRQPASMAFRVQSGIDWFELHADIQFDDQTVGFPELLAALARGDGTVRLSDGSWGVLPEEWARQFGLLDGLSVTEDDHVRFSSHQVALLDALLSGQEDVQVDSRYEELREKFRNFDGVTPVQEPDGFEGELRVYQQEGLGWLQFLREFQLGGCLADDMGLGKTVQFLALLLEHRRQAEKRVPSLVVVPRSLIFNWRQECERFTPELKAMEYTGLDRAALRSQFSEYDLILTTYGTLRRDIGVLRETQFDYVVLDEAQTIKNAGSQVARASRLLQASHRLALSGTPIENHMGDLWSIFEFLNPGMLGRSSLFRQFTADADDGESRQLLAQGLRPFILRRTKQQVASELPEKVEETIICEMGREQRALYNELRQHYRDSLMGMVREQGISRSRMHVLEALLRLRQAACHPGLLDEKRVMQPSAKLDALIPHLQELLEEGHKALVFSQFTSMLSIVRQHLDSEGITYEYLDGQTRDRAACVERFQTDDECGVFLISLKAGGLGLNLTAADYVFILDPWWNPAVEAQAIDRAHRVGQTRSVFAYRILCNDTVEEKIAALQQQKRELADAILKADSGGVLGSLSTEDLEMLLS